MKKKFEGANIVIIGATGGLGTSYARAFADEGASILLAGRNELKLQELAQALPEKTSVAQVDITSAESVEKLAVLASKWAEKIDIVVNATGFDVRKSLTEHQIAEIDKSVNINLIGSILISRAFLPHMRANKGSTIVHMGGFADGRLAFPYYSVDVATRSGIFSFVESINRELQQDGSLVRLTYFCPNSADTTAERPFHSVWKEMGISISSTDQVAAELLKAVEQKKTIYIMGGIATRFFAKLNSLSPKTADILLLNKYGAILKKYFGSNESKKMNREKKNSSLKKIALCMVVLSFGLYGLLPVVPFISFNLSLKMVIAGTIMGISEILFWLGSLILGKELIIKYRNNFNFFKCFGKL
ncbi:oxidoreductase [Enterococcus silesiacus]|uniref:Dehydrogenase n=1 Tax=Enterococcus silesiacus TaxID=332949 RepID=A0A0S3KCN2_9ENTE|nr:SDR family NAD(P)-dependent oxidoreductase [Enterococcus silesiacus]ALS02081.1 oxidoreductase [Enterococcus silesiacus]OJG91553.1 dehydrogenase [Enterococcus silesiacus]